MKSISALYISLTLFSLFLIPADIWAASEETEATVCSITKENGLAGVSVKAIITDNEGRKWIATSKGVNCYNGRRIITFDLPRKGRETLFTYDICQAGDHAILIATNGGVMRMAMDDNAFHSVIPAIPIAECIAEQNGVIYAGNHEGFHVWDGDELKTITVGATPMSIENSVRQIIAADSTKIWFLSRYALNCYNPLTGEVSSEKLGDKLPQGTAFSRFAIVHGKCYLGTKNGGLFIYDFRTKKVRHVNGVDNIVTSVLISPRNDICVSTDGSGAYLIDSRNDSIIDRFNQSATGTRHLPTNAVYCYTRDEGGVDWFGFYRYGLSFTYRSIPLFRSYRFGTFTTEGLNVRSFFIRGGEKVLGTTSGIYYIDERRNIIKHFTLDNCFGAHLFSCVNYFAGNYYIGTYDGGLLRLDPSDLTLTVPLGSPRPLKTASVHVLTVGPDRRLWIGTSEGIFVVDSVHRLTHYTENNARIIGYSISGLIFDASGKLWISGPKGLALYSTVSRQFENNNFPRGFLNNEPIRNSCLGHDGFLLFNTGSHINYSDTTMTHFGTFTLPAGVLDEWCYLFFDDMRGRYWAVTENGLFSMSYDMKNLHHYSYGNGLRCLFVNMLQTDSGGILWAATSNGLVNLRFNELKNVLLNDHYRVSLYDIRVGSSPLSFADERKVQKSRVIRLPWNIRSERLGMHFVLKDYAYQDNRLYEYRLDNDTLYTLTHDRHETVIPPLLPGRHRLRARLAGMPNTEATYIIDVRPSWLAITELIIIISAIVLLIFWRRYHQKTRVLLEERDDIEDALVEVDRELNQDKIQPDLGGNKEEKYSRVKIDNDECAEIVNRMRAYVEEKKVYTDPELKMSELADILSISPSRLSQVFNLYLHENYYEFINDYRLNAFKRLIDAGEHKRYTLTALSEKCGFKKSSFFSTFRRVEGMTPTEYVKKSGGKF